MSEFDLVYFITIRTHTHTHRHTHTHTHCATRRCIPYSLASEPATKLKILASPSTLESGQRACTVLVHGAGARCWCTMLVHDAVEWMSSEAATSSFMTRGDAVMWRQWSGQVWVSQTYRTRSCFLWDHDMKVNQEQQRFVFNNTSKLFMKTILFRVFFV